MKTIKVPVETDMEISESAAHIGGRFGVLMQMLGEKMAQTETLEQAQGILDIAIQMAIKATLRHPQEMQELQYLFAMMQPDKQQKADEMLDLTFASDEEVKRMAAELDKLDREEGAAAVAEQEMMQRAHEKLQDELDQESLEFEKIHGYSN